MKLPIFLDWDGVLINSAELYFNLLKTLCEEHRKEFPVPDLTGFRSWYKANWEVNFHELGFTDEEYLEFCANYPADLDYNQSSLFPGVPELLDRFSDHPKIVVSTAPTDNIVSHLKGAGLLDRFHSVNGSDDASTEKTGRLAALLAALGHTTGIMVGDTDLDIEAGKANNLVTVGVTYGWISMERVLAAEPDFTVSKPEDLGDKMEAALEKCLTRK